MPPTAHAATGHGRIRLLRTPSGRLRRLLLNLALRVSVKWTHGLDIDVERLRRRQARLERRLSRRVAQLSDAGIPGVRAEWLGAPGPGRDRTVLYLHGGAFIARSPAAHAAMVRPWCEALGARALMVDYRLAPEHAFPAAVEDGLTAYRGLLQQGHAAQDIVLAGDSAGGNLALAMLHRLCSAGEPLPACAVLLSPFTDFTLSSASMVANSRRDPVFTLAFAAAIRALYAPPERYLDPAVSPLFGDFSGLPPMLIQCGSTEMLLDDAVRTADRAQAAGVAVQLEVWDRMPHVFQAVPTLPQSRAATQSIVRYIGEHTGWTPAPQADAAAHARPSPGEAHAV